MKSMPLWDDNAISPLNIARRATRRNKGLGFRELEVYIVRTPVWLFINKG
jgi:hypothetical protein